MIADELRVDQVPRRTAAHEHHTSPMARDGVPAVHEAFELEPESHAHLGWLLAQILAKPRHELEDAPPRGLIGL